MCELFLVEKEITEGIQRLPVSLSLGRKCTGALLKVGVTVFVSRVPVLRTHLPGRADVGTERRAESGDTPGRQCEFRGQ